MDTENEEVLPTVKTVEGYSVEQLLVLIEAKLPTIFPRIKDILIANEIDGKRFLMLTIEDCCDRMDMRLGPALRLVNLATKIKLQSQSNGA